MRRATSNIVIIVFIVIIVVLVLLLGRLFYNERVKPKIIILPVEEAVIEPIDMVKMCYELDGMYINSKCIFPGDNEKG